MQQVKDLQSGNSRLLGKLQELRPGGAPSHMSHSSSATVWLLDGLGTEATHPEPMLTSWLLLCFLQRSCPPRGHSSGQPAIPSAGLPQQRRRCQTLPPSARLLRLDWHRASMQSSQRSTCALAASLHACDHTSRSCSKWPDSEKGCYL